MYKYTKHLQDQYGNPPYTQRQIASAMLKEYDALLRYGYIDASEGRLTVDDFDRIKITLDNMNLKDPDKDAFDTWVIVWVDDQVEAGGMLSVYIRKALDYANGLKNQLDFYKLVSDEHPVQYPLSNTRDSKFSGELIYHNPHFVFYEERFSRNHEERFSRNHYEKGWCDLRIYKHPDQFNHSNYYVLVITEPIDSKGEYMNDGQSVVNGVENIIFTLKYITVKLIGKNNQEITPQWDYYIEYLPARGKTLEPKGNGRYSSEEFAMVNIVNGQPEWKFMSRDDVENLIGMPFVYVPEK